MGTKPATTWVLFALVVLFSTLAVQQSAAAPPHEGHGGYDGYEERGGGGGAMGDAEEEKFQYMEECMEAALRLCPESQIETDFAAHNECINAIRDKLDAAKCGEWVDSHEPCRHDLTILCPRLDPHQTMQCMVESAAKVSAACTNSEFFTATVDMFRMEQEQQQHGGHKMGSSDDHGLHRGDDDENEGRHRGLGGREPEQGGDEL